MKTVSKKSCAVNVGRWMSYAAAGAAATLAVSNEAEATIFYSGTLNTVLNHGGTSNLSQPTEVYFYYANPHTSSQFFGSLSQRNRTGNRAFDDVRPGPNVRNFRIVGFKSAAHPYNGDSHFATKLGAGVNIGAQVFLPHTQGSITFGSQLPLLAGGTNPSPMQFLPGTTGFLAFEFKLGATQEYGWARLTNIPNSNGRGGNTSNVNDIKIVDLAYSDSPNFLTGQTAVPEPATAGLLALGAAGVLAMRVRRNRKAVA